MTDREFLTWIHERLEYVHEENPNMDYMWKLRSVIAAIPVDQEASNVGRGLLYRIFFFAGSKKAQAWSLRIHRMILQVKGPKAQKLFSERNGYTKTLIHYKEWRLLGSIKH